MNADSTIQMSKTSLDSICYVDDLAVCTSCIGDILEGSFRIQTKSFCNLRDSKVMLVCWMRKVEIIDLPIRSESAFSIC